MYICVARCFPMGDSLYIDRTALPSLPFKRKSAFLPACELTMPGFQMTGDGSVTSWEFFFFPFDNAHALAAISKSKLSQVPALNSNAVLSLI